VLYTGGPSLRNNDPFWAALLYPIESFVIFNALLFTML